MCAILQTAVPDLDESSGGPCRGKQIKIKQPYHHWQAVIRLRGNTTSAQIAEKDASSGDANPTANTGDGSTFRKDILRNEF